MIKKEKTVSKARIVKKTTSLKAFKKQPVKASAVKKTGSPKSSKKVKPVKAIKTAKTAKTAKNVKSVKSTKAVKTFKASKPIKQVKKPVVAKLTKGKKVTKNITKPIPKKVLKKKVEVTKKSIQKPAALKLNSPIVKNKSGKTEIVQKTKVQTPIKKPIIVSKEIIKTKSKKTASSIKSIHPAPRPMPSGKINKVINMHSLTPDLIEALNKKYPDGYVNHVFKVTITPDNFFYAVTIDLPDIHYLVKVPVKIDANPEEELEEKDFPEDIAAGTEDEGIVDGNSEDVENVADADE